MYSKKTLNINLSHNLHDKSNRIGIKNLVKLTYVSDESFANVISSRKYYSWFWTKYDSEVGIFINLLF